MWLHPITIGLRAPSAARGPSTAARCPTRPRRSPCCGSQLARTSAGMPPSGARGCGPTAGSTVPRPPRLHPRPRGAPADRTPGDPGNGGVARPHGAVIAGHRPSPIPGRGLPTRPDGPGPVSPGATRTVRCPSGRVVVHCGSSVTQRPMRAEADAQRGRRRRPSASSSLRVGLRPHGSAGQQFRCNGPVVPRPALNGGPASPSLRASGSAGPNTPGKTGSPGKGARPGSSCRRAETIGVTGTGYRGSATNRKPQAGRLGFGAGRAPGVSNCLDFQYPRQDLNL